GVPPRARGLVLRCVEKKAEDRPQSFRVVIEELRGLISGASEETQSLATKTVPIATPVVAPQPPRRSMAIWAVPVASIVMIGAGAVWWATRSAPPHKPPATQTPEAPAPVIPGMIYIPAGSF